MHRVVDGETAEQNEAEARSKLKSRFALFSQPLQTEAELFAMWGDSDEVVASIACATFEHGALLDDAIRSFLMQKPDFRLRHVTRGRCTDRRRAHRRIDLIRKAVYRFSQSGPME